MMSMWLAGLFRTRWGRTLGMVACLACAVALLFDLGLFIDQSARQMTARALQSLTTDLQIEPAPGADAASVRQAISESAPDASVASLEYAPIDTFEFSSGTSTQTTGAGQAVAVPAGYFAQRGGDIRVLAGNLNGAVLLQQTAANLHAQPGDVVTLKRTGMADTTVSITGIVDLKTADSFFQAVGVAPGAAPTAPPDNAILIPVRLWPQAFATDQKTELHVTVDRSQLSADPNEAYAQAVRLGKNIEARLAGRALLANNLAAQLDAARGDALYAKVLFLFLGTPGALVACLLALTVAKSGRATRAHDQELLRRRGATPARRVSLLVGEGTVTGAAAAIIGLLFGAATPRLLGYASVVAANQWPWMVGAGLLALVLGVLATLLGGASLPIFGAESITQAGKPPPELRRRRALWQRLDLDGVCLVLAGLVFWGTAATGYQVVLATEGVTATSVDYTAFLAPLLLWIGGGLLAVRLTEAMLLRASRVIRQALSQYVGQLSYAVAAALSWQRHRLALSTALVALAVAFLVSTAIFNATYDAQARVDAELTNGADVVVSGSITSPADENLATLRELPGVIAAQPMQHRFAYVGTDLQDLYGIDPVTLAKATDLSNAYFANHDAEATMAALSKRPDALLVSEETVTDFQLQLGDTLNLRLQGADKAYHVVPFVFAGVVREFPTAPHDSFLVANASYVAAKSGLASNEVVLIRSSFDPDVLKAEVSQALKGRPVQVSSLLDAVRTIGTNLTAVSLKGLSTIELAFGLLLAVGATGINLALGFADRQRDFAIMGALGANRRELAAFVWSEALVVAWLGGLAGACVGLAIAEMLITVLQGVFDPPPQAPEVPWLYLTVVLAVLAIAVLAAVLATVSRASSAPVTRSREFR